jgi:hypothetical protein
MMIQVFWDVLLCQLVVTNSKEALHSTKTTVTVYKLTKHNIPEDLNLHHHLCQNLKCHNEYHIDSFKVTGGREEHDMYNQRRFCLYDTSFKSSIIIRLVTVSSPKTDDSLDSVISIVPRIWTRQSGVQIPARAKDFSLLQNIQSGSGAHPASHAIDPMTSFPRGKAASVRS